MAVSGRYIEQSPTGLLTRMRELLARPRGRSAATRRPHTSRAIAARRLDDYARLIVLIGTSQPTHVMHFDLTQVTAHDRRRSAWSRPGRRG